jgi:hypothetical protein
LVLENVVGGWVDGLFRNLLYELWRLKPPLAVVPVD